MWVVAFTTITARRDPALPTQQATAVPGETFAAAAGRRR
jgi:hypothetical protein